MQDDLPVNERDEADVRVRVRPASTSSDSFPASIRTAPRGAESRIGDDETHRRLQDARNRARHTTESLIRRELGPEWAEKV